MCNRFANQRYNTHTHTLTYICVYIYIYIYIYVSHFILLIKAEII